MVTIPLTVKSIIILKVLRPGWKQEDVKFLASSVYSNFGTESSLVLEELFESSSQIELIYHSRCNELIPQKKSIF